VQTGKKIVDFRQATRLRKSGEVGGSHDLRSLVD
jgi:hypothetical protein